MFSFLPANARHNRLAMKRSGIAVRVQLFVPPEWLFVIGYLILSRLLVLPLRGFARLLPSEIRPPASPEPARHSPEAKPMADGQERWRPGGGQASLCLSTISRGRQDFKYIWDSFNIPVLIRIFWLLGDSGILCRGSASPASFEPGERSDVPMKKDNRCDSRPSIRYR